jgi:CRP-like cAMP-binding protein
MAADPQLSPETLAAMEPFQGLSIPALAKVGAAARLCRLPKGQRIFNQGDYGVRAHVIIEGAVRISQSGGDGAQVIIRFVAPGEMFGAVALFTDGRYPADAVTLSEMLEASWSEADLLAIYLLIAINVIRVIGRRLQEVQQRVRELATQNAERRVAHTLLRLAHQAGHRVAEGTAIEFPPRRRDVADVAGITLHTASRILAAWEKEGLIVSHNQHLTIRRRSDLLRIAHDGPE